MDESLERFLRTKLRSAGRQYEETKRAYRDGRNGDGADVDLPRGADGRARIVCRRHVERRTVAVDSEGRPNCFDEDHPDCRGCAEDVREGAVETW